MKQIIFTTISILTVILIINFSFFDPKLDAQNKIKKEINIGDKVPDIKMKNPGDTLISLSSIDGKLVLIDFWASWCGPCRKENPSVVAAYKKYKDEKFKKVKCKGFTVFSVSLDKDKNSWIKAIAKDSLNWPYHVSDLKYWNNAAALDYGVSFIPYNFLVDKNGIVLAKNLRGTALEAKLEELIEK